MRPSSNLTIDGDEEIENTNMWKCLSITMKENKR